MAANPQYPQELVYARCLSVTCECNHTGMFTAALIVLSKHESSFFTDLDSDVFATLYDIRTMVEASSHQHFPMRVIKFHGGLTADWKFIPLIVLQSQEHRAVW